MAIRIYCDKCNKELWKLLTNKATIHPNSDNMYRTLYELVNMEILCADCTIAKYKDIFPNAQIALSDIFPK